MAAPFGCTHLTGSLGARRIVTDQNVQAVDQLHHALSGISSSFRCSRTCASGSACDRHISPGIVGAWGTMEPDPAVRASTKC